MAELLHLLRILTTVIAFTITICAFKKSNENPVFKYIAPLTGMLGFWNLICIFLMQTTEPQLYFFMVRAIYICIAFSALFLFYYAQSYCLPDFPSFWGKCIAAIPCITALLSITASKYSCFISLQPNIETVDTKHSSLICGTWFYVHIAYSYGLVLASCILFVIKALLPEVKNRKMIVAMMANTLFFTAMNTIILFYKTDFVLLLLKFAHLLSINAFYFLTYLDTDQKIVFYSKKEFFQNFNQPVLVFNVMDELLEINAEVVQFFTQANIPVKRYMSYGAIFDERFFTPIKSREQTDTLLYFQHKETGKVFLCHKNVVLNPRTKKKLGTTIVMYDAALLGDLVQKIEQNAFIDALCGCLNRSCFELRKDSIIKHIDKPCLLLVADIDNLKKVNDQCGHKAGDEYIQTCVAILKETIKTPNTLFRIGGDEFCTFISHGTEADAERIVNKIANLCKAQHEQWPVSISIGFSVIEDDNADFEQCFAQADSNMYLQKQSHKEALA
ncbi:MAG: histidine kinase N-terminal 7TM domain-containing diguanylate cyclase [Treponema sp.]